LGHAYIAAFQHKAPRRAKRVRTSWLIVIFDTLLKIASRFSSAVVRDTHDLLMAKSFLWGLLSLQTSMLSRHCESRRADFRLRHQYQKR
jgi:hypothetical protein